MDRYTRLFILASLFHLSAGGLLGLLVGVQPQWRGWLLFSHVHLLLLGFMAMMVFGVGNFILPRFAGTNLRWEFLVTAQFWTANISLVALVVARPLGVIGGSAGWTGIFHLAATFQLLSLLMFTLNLGATLLAPRRPSPRAEASASPAGPTAGQPSRLPTAAPGAARPPAGPPVGPDTPIGELVQLHPGVLPLIIQAGLRPLADPEHLEMVRARGLTIGYACERHGIDVQALLARIRELGGGAPVPASPAAAEPLTPDSLIGQVAAESAALEDVFRRRFGEGCFTCPGFATETLAQAALMHGVEVGELIAELEAARS
jgi:hypothetical protein